jgi:hypothetical protein
LGHKFLRLQYKENESCAISITLLLQQISNSGLKLAKITSRHRRYYHPSCYTADLYIPANVIQFAPNLKDKDRKAAEAAVAKLNAGKIPTDKPRFETHEQFLIKRIEVP